MLEKTLENLIMDSMLYREHLAESLVRCSWPCFQLYSTVHLFVFSGTTCKFVFNLCIQKFTLYSFVVAFLWDDPDQDQ